VRRRYLKAEQWQELIAEQTAGTESVVDFCQRNNVTPKSFYQHRKAVREADSHAGMVMVAPPASLCASRQMAVSWKGVELTLPGSASPGWVAQLMRELANASVS